MLYDEIIDNALPEIVIPNDLQYLDNQSPFELSQTINLEFQRITNFDDIFQNNNISAPVKNKLNDLKLSLLNIGKSKFDEAIYNNDESIINDEAAYIQNLENEVSQELNNFNLSIGTSFTLTPAEKNQLLISSYLAGESMNNSEVLMSHFQDMQSPLQISSTNITVNGFFKSVLKVLKAIAVVVLVIVVTAAIVAAVVAVGALIGGVTGAVLVVGGAAVASGATAGALFGLYIGGSYIASDD